MVPRRVRIALVQMSMSEDEGANLDKALAAVDRAAVDGADIVCLPELFAWRYFPSARGARASPQRIPGQVSQELSGSAKKNHVVLVGGSIYEVSGKSRYNTCLVFGEDGRMLSKYRKVHIPQDDHYFEQDYFASGRSYGVAKTEVCTVGALVCFDQWYPEPARISHLLGADVLFYPTAIGWVKGIKPVEGDWKKAWEAVQVGHAIANSMVVCAVNRVGREGDTDFWGGSFVSDQFGKILLRAGDQEGVFAADCDLSLGRSVEEGWGFMRNRKKGTYSAITK